MSQETKYKKYLRKKGISQTKVAKALNMSIDNVNKFANGYQNITLKTLKKFCQFHNCGPNNLIDWEQWTTSKKTSGKNT